MDFTQPVHNAVFQEISTVENELSLFDVVNVKGIFYNIGVLETATKGPHPYSSHEEKHQSDVIGGWVDNSRTLLTLCWSQMKTFSNNHNQNKKQNPT